jgi:UDP-3-O-[3-hydroxymyristoyl] glucosamine N-acyltransferase
MGLTVAEIARRLGGRVEGDGSIEISGVAGLKEAGAGDISFLGNPRYAADVAHTGASAVLVNEDWSGTCPAAVVRVRDANAAFAEAAAWLMPGDEPAVKGIHPTAVIAGDVTLGADVGIGPYCVLEAGVSVGARTVLLAGCCVGQGSSIGDDCRLYPHVSVRERTRIGNRVIIHNGAVIGSDGFGYTREGAKWKKIPQRGRVVIGDDVEIGANTTIDRGRFGKTRVGRGTKIDNLVQIGHNCAIGEDCIICGAVGIAGSVVIGNHVTVAGQVGIAGHLTIGDNAVILAQSGIAKDVPAGTIMFGTPAVPHTEFKRMNAAAHRLPELLAKLRELEQQVAELRAHLDSAT